MGTKYSTVSISGYNSAPPSDDGSATEANKIKWSTIKTKLPDPLKTAIEAINTALVSFADQSPTDKTADYTTTATDHLTAINCTSGVRINLGDASSMGAGYIVTVKNRAPSGNVTVAPITSANGMNGIASSRVVLGPMQAETFWCNGTTYYTAGGNWIGDAADPSKQVRFDTSGLPTGTTAVITISGSSAVGETLNAGRLAYVSATQIRLDPHNGNKLFVNGTFYTIPSAGVSLTNSSLSATTLYYIYAYINSGSMTLEASADAYATDSSYGHKIKTGDGTRTLVGMVYTDSGSPCNFADSAGKRWVRSWFNDPGVVATGSFSTSRTVSSGTWVEVNSEIRAQYLSWSGERISINHSGISGTGPTQGQVYVALGIDNTTPLDGYILWMKENIGGAVNHPANVGWDGTNSSEGNHYATLLSQIVTSNATFNSSNLLRVHCSGRK